MLSVLRLAGTMQGQEWLDTHAASVERVLGRPALSARHRGDGYSVVVSDDDSLDGHVAAVEALITESTIVSGARSRGLMLELDLALELDVATHRPWIDLRFPTPFLSRLVDAGIALVVSVYPIESDVSD